MMIVGSIYIRGNKLFLFSRSGNKDNLDQSINQILKNWRESGCGVSEQAFVFASYSADLKKYLSLVLSNSCKLYRERKTL